MLKKLSRKLAVAVASLVLAAGVSGARDSAQAGTVQQVVNVGPGQRVCIRSSEWAYNSASVYDEVLYGPPVKFIFLSGTTEISESWGPVLSYYDYIAVNPRPSFFGTFSNNFRTCARNDDYFETATVSLSVTVD